MYIFMFLLCLLDKIDIEHVSNGKRHKIIITCIPHFSTHDINPVPSFLTRWWQVKTNNTPLNYHCTYLLPSVAVCSSQSEELCKLELLGCTTTPFKIQKKCQVSSKIYHSYDYKYRSSAVHYVEAKLQQLESNLPLMLNAMLPFWAIFFR